MLTEDRFAIRELLDSYGVSQESEDILENALLTENPFDIDIDFPKEAQSKATKVNDEFLYSIGLELEHTRHYEDETDDFGIPPKKKKKSTSKKKKKISSKKSTK